VIQIAVVGDPQAAFYAAKKGFAVLGLEPELESHVAKAGGVFIFFGGRKAKLSIVFSNIVDAASKMVDSAELVIIGKGKLAKFVKQIAETKGKQYVEGKGKDAVEKAKERLVRFNLFGVKS
jgi:hypothetical protein